MNRVELGKIAEVGVRAASAATYLFTSFFPSNIAYSRVVEAAREMPRICNDPGRSVELYRPNQNTIIVNWEHTLPYNGEMAIAEAGAVNIPGYPNGLLRIHRDLPVGYRDIVPSAEPPHEPNVEEALSFVSAEDILWNTRETGIVALLADPNEDLTEALVLSCFDLVRPNQPGFSGQSSATDVTEFPRP